MNRVRCTAAVLVMVVSLTGCAPGDSAVEPTSTTTTEGGIPLEHELTWQEAKAQTQAMDLEIAKVIPDDQVVKIDQDRTGTLFSCSETQHNWTGSTTITLTEGAEPESLVKGIEAQYQDSRFNIKTRIDPSGDYEVQLRSPDTAEIYLIGGWDADTIRIDSGSTCFTLPEGEYAGGDF